MMNYPNVVCKLGLENHQDDQSLFCRITPTQLEASGEPIVYLKKQAILLFQDGFEDDEVIIDNFNVSLKYKDTEGDRMIIRTPEDLIAALEEHTDAGKIKILAQVNEKQPASTRDQAPTAKRMKCSHDDDSSSCSDDSSSSSDDSHFQITVQGAGCEAVNGVYTKNGLYEDCYKYTKHGKWMDRDFEFHIFRYEPSAPYRWFITAVPVGKELVTGSDIDFYCSYVDDDCHMPPKSGWWEDEEGTSPLPTLAYSKQINPAYSAAKRTKCLCDDWIFTSSLDAGPSHITVHGAGCAAVNGVYSQGSKFGGPFHFFYMYTKHGEWDGSDVIFTIYRHSKTWYIAAVPPKELPRISPTIDFYHIDEDRLLPPRSGWLADKSIYGKPWVGRVSGRPHVSQIFVHTLSPWSRTACKPVFLEIPWCGFFCAQSIHNDKRNQFCVKDSAPRKYLFLFYIPKVGHVVAILRDESFPKPVRVRSSKIRSIDK